MGLIVSVFRSSIGDCTKNGISSVAADLCLVNVEGPFVPQALTAPAAMLVKGNIEGSVKIVPCLIDGNGKYVPTKSWVMMGGNFGYTSDSRFHNAVRSIIGKGAVSYGAVPIHDRIE